MTTAEDAEDAERKKLGLKCRNKKQETEIKNRESRGRQKQKEKPPRP